MGILDEIISKLRGQPVEPNFNVEPDGPPSQNIAQAPIVNKGLLDIGSALPEQQLQDDRYKKSKIRRVVASRPGETDYELENGVIITTTGVVSDRTNNPGNITVPQYYPNDPRKSFEKAKRTLSWFKNAVDFIGPFKEQTKGGKDVFQYYPVYQNQQDGSEAARFLLTKGKAYKNKSIKSALATWAPLKGDDTTQYTNTIVNEINKNVPKGQKVTENTLIKDLSDAQMKYFQAGMKKQEGSGAKPLQSFVKSAGRMQQEGLIGKDQMNVLDMLPRNF